MFDHNESNSGEGEEIIDEEDEQMVEASDQEKLQNIAEQQTPTPTILFQTKRK